MLIVEGEQESKIHGVGEKGEGVNDSYPRHLLLFSWPFSRFIRFSVIGIESGVLIVLRLVSPGCPIVNISVSLSSPSQFHLKHFSRQKLLKNPKARTSFLRQCWYK